MEVVARGPYPVVIFTPGYTATFTDYTFLFEDLASRGYIVASVARTYESTVVQLPNGRLAKSVLGSHLDNSWHANDETFAFATSVRLRDLEFVLNQLARLNSQPGNPFTSQLELSKIAIAGHSMGGMTALLASRLDSRFKAVVMLDAAVAPALVSRTNTPVALLVAGRNQWDSGECRLWSGLEGPRLAVNFQGDEHVTFSDWIWLTKTGIQTGPMGPERTISAVRDYVAAFLDTQLRHGLPSPLLAGPSSEYPDATVITQGQSLCHQP
jgi:putative ABC transport system permease protein